ncbi:MAG: tetraacyldisaccharide 4'-kinase [Gammaproteobacteria bacterium]|nr:tetraacyldisaccharide 4'-kinase [Gammaproteobacteria bacterium]
MKSITHYWQSINFVSMMLAPISFLFCSLVFIRRLCYRLGIFKSVSEKLPVIVVGNIYIGGSGKTPFVIWLVEQLKDAGYKPAVVSRGYGALNEKEADLPWPRLVNLQQDIRLFGDEPFIIHQATQCPVVVDPDRKRAVKKISRSTDCDVIISDDGLQHYAMSRFIEINITDARRLYGNGLCLPAGPLREGVGRLNSVDYIIYNISRGFAHKTVPQETIQYPEKTFSMEYELLLMKSLSEQTEQSMTLKDFKGKIVHAVAGIGDPEQFFTLLKNYGLIVIEHPFNDHYQYKKSDLVFDEPHPVIMTEKDAVKCRRFSLSDSWYLPIKAKIDHNLLIQIVNQLKTY